MKELRIGDRVRVYDIDQCDGATVSDTGEIVNLSGSAVCVRFDHWDYLDPGCWIWRSKCRKLRKKRKKIFNSKEELAKVWDSVFGENDHNVSRWFHALCAELGVGANK